MLAALAIPGAVDMLLTSAGGFLFGLPFVLAVLAVAAIRAPDAAGRFEEPSPAVAGPAALGAEPAAPRIGDGSSAQTSFAAPGGRRRVRRRRAGTPVRQGPLQPPSGDAQGIAGLRHRAPAEGRGRSSARAPRDGCGALGINTSPTGHLGPHGRVIRCMARVASALPSTSSGPTRRRRCRALGLLSLVLAVPGCETLERMDYLDRFFEPSAVQRPVAASEWRPDPAPAPALDRSPPPGPVVAMEPRPDPPPSWSAADRGFQPGPVVAMGPRPNPPSPPVSTAALDGSVQPNRARPAEPPATDPEARTRLLVRQNPWLTQFWMELTPAQQARVERQLQRGGTVLAAERTEPAAAWDSMGLADRAKLIFGNGGRPPFERPAPPERRNGAIWAGNS